MVKTDALKVPVVISNFGSVSQSVRLTETAADPSLKVVLPTAAITVAVNTTVTTFVTVTGNVEKFGAALNLVATATAGTATSVTSQACSINVVKKDLNWRLQTFGGMIGSTAKSNQGPNNATV